jgi:Beta-lactamase enzyme family
MCRNVFLISLLISCLQVKAQDNPLVSILKSEKFKQITENPLKYRVQILYTQINRDKHNKPTLKTYSYRTDSEEYFYPASTVKLAANVLALEKINALKLDKNWFMYTMKGREGQQEITQDLSAESGKPSVAHYIKKILLVSDNESYNRLYEFLGQKDFNQSMKSKGFKGVRFTHRLQVPLTPFENQFTNPIEFVDTTGRTRYTQMAAFNDQAIFSKKPILLGKGFRNSQGQIEHQPYDFTLKNAFPLAAQHEFLQRLMLPEAFPKRKQFSLTQEDYSFLYQYMSQYPTETRYPNYLMDSTYHPTYCKFIYYGSDKNEPLNKNIRIFNKVGDAYGFLLDNAYVVDFENQIEFMVSAVILCNEDEIFNDDLYDYERIGFPFLKQLGQEIHGYEMKRPKKYLPKLDHLKIKYER